MANSVFYDIPVLRIGFRNRCKELFQFSSCGKGRHRRDNPANGFTPALNNEFFALVSDAVDDVGKVSGGFGG